MTANPVDFSQPERAAARPETSRDDRIEYDQDCACGDKSAAECREQCPHRC